MKNKYIARKENFGWLVFSQGDKTVNRVDEYYVERLKKVEDVRIIENRSVKNALTAPTKVFIDLSNMCNLKCIHCYSDSKLNKYEEIPHDKINQLIKEMSEIGVFSFKIGGGEPFLRNDMWEIAEQVTNYGMRLSYNTNGTIINEEIINNLIKYHITIGVSLDGTREMNDKIRGNGSFDKTIKTIKWMNEAGVDMFVQFTLMNANIDNLYDFICLDELRDLSIKIGRVKPKERAYVNNQVIKHDEKYKKIIRYINSFENCDMEDVMRIKLKNGNSNVLNPLDCGAGTRILSIKCDGSVYPCGFMDSKYKVGSIYENSILEIWQNEDKFKNVRQMYISNECITCKRQNICRGGCLAMKNMFENNEIKDPGCLRDIF